MAPVYMLKVNRSKDLLNPQITYYAQGMNIEHIPLNHIERWTICKMTFPRGSLVIKSLNLVFIRFQQRLRDYLRFLRRVRSIRFLLRRELGKVNPPAVGK